MDLIKNYGSYENAKAELEKIKSTKYRNYMYLEDALLEYRRANNIFEVGDLVTHPKYEWKILKVHDPIEDQDLLFAKTNDHVKHHWGHGLIFEDNYVVCVSYFGCRHATLEEIQAGHRL